VNTNRQENKNKPVIIWMEEGHIPCHISSWGRGNNCMKTLSQHFFTIVLRTACIENAMVTSLSLSLRSLRGQDDANNISIYMAHTKPLLFHPAPHLKKMFSL
jgi:hypothetical protein